MSLLLLFYVFYYVRLRINLVCFLAGGIVNKDDC